jgi:hypothetical protein
LLAIVVSASLTTLGAFAEASASSRGFLSQQLDQQDTLQSDAQFGCGPRSESTAAIYGKNSHRQDLVQLRLLCHLSKPSKLAMRPSEIRSGYFGRADLFELPDHAIEFSGTPPPAFLVNCADPRLFLPCVALLRLA